MLPAAQWQVLDTWNRVASPGSGSHDYTIADTFVPAENTWVYGESHRSSTLYAWRGMFVVNFVGVPLGVALEACDVATAILAGKISMPGMIPARDEPRVRAGSPGLVRWSERLAATPMTLPAPCGPRSKPATNRPSNCELSSPAASCTR